MKRLFALFISIIMLLSFMPSAMAVESAALPAGNAEGEVTIGDIAFFGSGVSGNLGVLDDNFYYSSYDIKNSLSGAWLAESNLDKVVKFIQTDSGLEFSWDSETDIKRVDLWILSVGGIEDYTLSYYNNGEWKTAKDSSFTKYDKELVEPAAATSSMNGATRASYYPIVLEETIKAEKLRFTIDSFYENNQTNVGKVPVAYVSEVKVRSDNNVNLGDLTFYGVANGGRWSPYLHGYQIGAVTNIGTSSSSNGYSMPQWNGFMWPGYSDSTIAYLSQDYDCSTENAGIWYISRLWRSKVKINRVGIDLYSGSITEFEVWANRKDVAEPWNWTMEIPITDSSWEKIATFRCNLTPSNDDVLFDIPNGFEASQYMIRATKYDKTANHTTRIGGFKLYALADSELNINLSSEKQAVFDAIETDTGEKGKARKEFILPKTLDGSELVWSTDSDLVELSEETDFYKATVKLHDNEEEITLRADYYHTGGGIYKLTGSFTLVPYINQCNISVSDATFPDGKDKEILNDGIFGSVYDKAAENEASFMKITENSAIEYVWDEKTDVRGFEIWAKPGVIKDCTIQYKESSSDEYQTLDKEKYVILTTDVNECERADAVYCPVVLKEKLNAQCLKIQFTLADGKTVAELSEAACSIDTADLAKAPAGAEDTLMGYSHYITQYVAGKTSGDTENPMAQKSTTSVWPVKDDGTELNILSEDGRAWYAAGLADTKLNVNRVVIPITAGSAKEIQVLYAKGDESGFDYASSDPACPDTKAAWEIAATVQGNFTAGNSVSIDLSSEILSRYWMVKVEDTSEDFAMGRVSFYMYPQAELSAITQVLDGIFGEVYTDVDGNSVKSLLKLPKKYNDCDISWSKGEDIDNILTLDTSSDPDYVTGNVADHDKDRKIILTAAVTAPGTSGIKYCVKKEYDFKGLLTVSVLKMVDGTLTTSETTDILTDDFAYVQYDYQYILEKEGAFKHPEKFIHLKNPGEGFEFSYETEKIRRRFELWAWPLDCISKWKVEYFDGAAGEWKECGSGEICDQYEDNQSARPADQAKDSVAGFYPIVFEKAVTAKRFRFIATAFREADPEKGAYIAEADLMETNDTNYVMMDSLKLSDTIKKKHPKASLWSKYIGRSYVSFVENNNVNYCLDGNEVTIWPATDAGPSGRIGIKAVTDDYFNEAEGEALAWYYTSFTGGLVAVNSASITIGKGTATEFEVMCAETRDGTPAWNRPPQRPDTVKSYRTVAKIGGEFKAGDTVKVAFDNKFESKHWLIKITKASDDFVLKDAGLYTYSEEEIDKAARVLDNVFDNVTESGIDNVIIDKINIPNTLNITVDSEQGSYSVNWIYDNTVINADGTVIPASEDREMTLTAQVKSTDGKYSHIVSKDFSVIGQDNRAKTLLSNETDISVDADMEIDVTPENGFTYSKKQTLEMEFGDTVNAAVTLKADTKALMLLTVDKDSNTITVDDGESEALTAPFSDKIKLELQDGTYAFYVWDTNREVPGYSLLNYGRKLKINSSLKTALMQNQGTQPSVISKLQLSVPSEVLFDEIESQFDFLSISTERATDLNTAPNPISKVEDITFSYSSDDTDVISFAENAGVWSCNLNNSTYDSATITVTATQAGTGKSFVKSFEVITGKDNVFSEGSSTSKAAPVEDNIASYALDGCLETDFVTNAAKYNIVLNLGKTAHFNKLRIMPAENTEGSITKYSVDISNDGINYTEDVSTGTSLNGSDIINVGYQSARYVRFNVEQTSANGTGIKEICAYNEMTDQEMLDYEFKALTETLLTVADKTVIPKNGEIFGTEFKFSPSQGAPVSVVETDDKKGWKLVVGNSTEEVTVTITLSAKKGSATATKPYPLTILASSDIGGNTIGGDAPTVGGGSSSGGGGGGGGGASATNIPITPQPEQNTTSQSAALKELEGHWGANEIKNLIADGIVQGDGEKLDLTRSVTRAEFCKMLLAGFNYELEEYKGTFADVTGDMWFARYAETAAKHGIMNGDASGFRGNAPISRQEMAVVIINLLKAQEEETATEKEASFTDEGYISDWAKEKVKMAAGLGLLNGYDTGDFKPEKSLQRDEAMVVVYRVLSHVGK